MLKSVRRKMIEDELFTLYRDSALAWNNATTPQMERFARSVDKRIEYLESKLSKLSGLTGPVEVV